MDTSKSYGFEEQQSLEEKPVGTYTSQKCPSQNARLQVSSNKNSYLLSTWIRIVCFFTYFFSAVARSWVDLGPTEIRKAEWRRNREPPPHDSVLVWVGLGCDQERAGPRCRDGQWQDLWFIARQLMQEKCRNSASTHRDIVTAFLTAL